MQTAFLIHESIKLSHI